MSNIKRSPATYGETSPASNRPRRRRMRLGGIPALALAAWLAVAALTGDGSAEAQTSALSVADFDQGGLQVVALASFTAGGATTLYSSADSRWGATGSLLEGDVGLSADSKIARVMVPARNGSLLRLNDDGPLVLRAWFGESGAGADLTVWLQTDAGTTSVAANDFKTAGNGYVNFNVPATGRAILTGISAGRPLRAGADQVGAGARDDVDARANADADARANANVDARANANADADARANADVDARANADADVDARANADADADARANADGDARANVDARADANADARANANADARDDERWRKRPEPLGAVSGRSARDHRHDRGGRAGPGGARQAGRNRAVGHGLVRGGVDGRARLPDPGVGHAGCGLHPAGADRRVAAGRLG